MASDHQIIDIGILVQANAQLSVVYGILDLFEVARLCIEQLDKQSKVKVRLSQWEKSTNSHRISCRSDSSHSEKPSHLHYVIVPPTLNKFITTEDAQPWVRWIRSQHEKETIICSVCSGAFLLAQTGLLDGREMTTHWYHASSLQERFPDTIVNTSKLIIDHGDVVSAGGYTSWIDLGLNLTEKIHGKRIMSATAKMIVADPPGREQIPYGRFLPKLTHGDEDILNTQLWLHKNFAQKVSIKRLSRIAKMGERTFIRRIKKVSGLTPTQYLQHLRVNRARDLLERTSKNIDQISYAVGYEDVTAFRKTFHKLAGLTPREYRSKFAGGRS